MKKLTYLILLLTGILVIVSILTKNIYVVGISVVLILIEYLLIKFGEHIFALGTKTIKATEGKGPYEMNEERNIIVKHTDKGYYASSFFEIIVGKDKGDFRRVVQSITFPCKISIGIYNLDLSKEIEKIKEKRSRLEAKRAIEKDKYEVAKLDREIALLNNLLEKINKGQRPVEIIFYVMVSASSRTKEEAIMKLKHNKRSLKSIMASAGYELRELIGDELWKAVEWEYFAPIRSEIDV